MDLATIRDAGQREARAELDQLTATGGPGTLAGTAWERGSVRAEDARQYRRWIEEERLTGDGARGERGLGGARLAGTTTGTVIESIPAPPAASGARVLARLLKAAGRWFRPRERRTPAAGFRMPFRLPEIPSPAEMTIIETPFRIPRYMDHPEWRPR